MQRVGSAFEIQFLGQIIEPYNFLGIQILENCLGGWRCWCWFSVVSYDIFSKDTKCLNHIQSCLTFVIVVLVSAKTPGEGWKFPPVSACSWLSPRNSCPLLTYTPLKIKHSGRRKNGVLSHLTSNWNPLRRKTLQYLLQLIIYYK